MKTEKPAPNRYLVVLEDDVVPDNLPLEVRRERISALAKNQAKPHGGAVDYIYETAFKGYAVQLPNEAAARALSNSPRVKWVEEDALVEVDQAPASPQPSPPWGLDALDSFLPVPSPDPTTGRNNGFFGFGANGSGVTVYVLDTGIHTAHQEFMTPSFSRASQVADCYTFVNCVSGQMTTSFNQQLCGTGLPNPTNNDCHGHGTHMAGIIGGNIFGVAKNVTIKSVKVLSNGNLNVPNFVTATIAGLNWVTGQASPSNPAVINMSLNLPPSQGVETAVGSALAAGLSVVASAGNSNADISTQAPANVPDALTVGAVDWNGAKYSLSNVGLGVDLFAPGVFVAAAQSGNSLCGFWNGNASSICISSGTSQAAAHVSGAVALYLQVRPFMTGCGTAPIQGQAPITANPSSCPDRVARFIVANAKINLLTNIAGSPNRFLSVSHLPGPANPNDNNQFFVWTQYRDFLNRDPDTIGYTNGTNNLNSCNPSDWPCLNAQRIHAVRGMIESTEFRTGKPALSNPTSTDQYNREYIHQLYVCMLRRNEDTTGFNNWLTFLNATGDYSHVVHGFVNSAEYRRRFGPP